MKFCPVVTEICRGQVHVPKKERRKRRIRIRTRIAIANINPYQHNFTWHMIFLQGFIKFDQGISEKSSGQKCVEE
jgi:hypothetical protein